MNSPLTVPRVLRFGVFEADLRTGELRKHGTRIKLQDQPFQVLAMLLERPGELVSREEIQKQLWPADTFVDFEHGLNTAVRRLRDALNDSADDPKWIETLPRRGYRFLGTVTPNAADATSAAEPPVHAAPPSSASSVPLAANAGSVAAQPQPRRHLLRFLGIAIVIALFGAIASRFLSQSAPIDSLAVLPFANPANDPE